MPERQSRADRILDAAGELLLQFGHRKVTIEDVANRAKVGKGTVYLHWRTKTVLFRALFLRETIDATEEILEIMSRDPDEAMPHRFLKTTFLISNRRPLTKALFTGDMDLIGILKDSPFPSEEMLANEEFYGLMLRNSLLRTDIPDIAYGIQAVATGFHLVDSLSAEVEQPDVDAKAELLAYSIRSAFEPATAPSPESLTRASSELRAIFGNLISTYRKWIYEHDPESTS